MIIAASTASGRLVNSGVSARTVIRLRIVAMTGESSVRAPAPSLTAVCDRLPPAERAGSDVGQAQRDHVLARVQAVAVLIRERLGGAERLAEDHQHHAGRAGQQDPQVRHAESHRVDRRQPGGDLPDGGYAVIVEVEDGADHDGTRAARPARPAAWAPGRARTAGSGRRFPPRTWPSSHRRGAPAGGRTAGSCHRCPFPGRKSSATG